MVNFFEHKMAGLTNNPFRVSGFHFGIVKDLDDPDGLNRVKVTLPMLADKGIESTYANVVIPMAGKDYGFTWVPDVGEIVIVGFLSDRIENPIIFGSIHTKEAKPYEIVDKDKNSVHVLKLKDGPEIRFDQKDGKNKASIQMKDETIMCIDEEKQVVKMQDKKGENGLSMNYKSGEFSIFAKKKVVIKAGKDMMVLEDGKGLSVKSNSGDFKADVSNVKLNAKTNFEAKGNASAKLESNGQTTIGGTMIQCK